MVFNLKQFVSNWKFLNLLDIDTFFVLLIELFICSHIHFVWFAHGKKFQPISAFPSLYCDFYILIIATFRSVDTKSVVLYAHLTN